MKALASAGRARPIRRALAVLAVAWLAAACGSDGPFGSTATLTRPCGVVVDGSGSGTEFHADERLKAKLDGFLVDQGCAQLTFVPLNSISETSPCSEERLDLDPQVGDPQAVRTAGRAEALVRSLRMLDCARKDADTSDVLGALRRVGTTRPPGSGSYAVLVVSDMIQIGQRVNLLRGDLDTPQGRAGVIAQVGDLAPNLPDTVLYPTDLSTNIRDARRGQDVSAFWLELFATDRTGHPTINPQYHG